MEAVVIIRTSQKRLEIQLAETIGGGEGGGRQKDKVWAEKVNGCDNVYQRRAPMSVNKKSTK